MNHFKLWSIAKRLYNGDAKAGKRRQASFRKIEKAAEELINNLNSNNFDWKRAAGYLRAYSEREFQNPYFSLSAAREIFEQPYEEICDQPVDRIKIAFEWTAREVNHFAPALCFEVRKPRNWKNPKVRLISAEGTPVQLERFAKLITTEINDMKEIKFS